MRKNSHLGILSIGLVLALGSLSSFPLGATSPAEEASRPQSRPAAGAELGSYLERLEGLGFAGAALVAVDGEVVLARGYGLADREREIPWTTATVSSVGSITKQFTAAAILKLVVDGKLETGDPIARFFEGVPEDKRGITVHQLLTHTAGLSDILGGDFDPIERDELVALAMAEPLDSPPGETYAYSNLGYSLLGAIVEKLSGKDYEEYLRSELLEPAGLYETGYALPGFELGRVARGYREGEEWGTVLERPWLPDGPSWHLRANGGIHSTVFDMYRWMRALQGERLFPAEARDRLFTPASDEGGGSFYGYGWAIVETDRGTRVIGHSGGNGILFSDVRWFPDEDVFVFLMTNVAEYPAEAITPGIAGILFGETVAMPPEVVTVDPERLAALAGTYGLPGGGELVVAVGEGTLEVEARDAAALVALYEPGRKPGDEAKERAESRDRRIELVVEGILNGDYAPLTEAYGGRHALDVLADVYSQRIERMESEMGEARGFGVLGTAGDGTFFHIDFADGTFWGRYLWEGVSLQGLELLDGPPRLTFHPTATEPALELQAFRLGSDLATRIAFADPDRLQIRSEEEDREPIVATRAAGGDGDLP